jgi:hypothetical protein
MLHLGRWQGLGECVCNHVIGQAVNKAQGTLLDDPSDEVVAHVDVLHVRMVLMVLSE